MKIEEETNFDVIFSSWRLTELKNNLMDQHTHVPGSFPYPQFQRWLENEDHS